MTRRYFLLPVLFFLLAYCLPLGWRPLIIPDEYRYAEIPREMIVQQDYVTPRLLNARYFEKPVLGYQLTALAFRWFGYSNVTIRLQAALGAALAAAAIWLLLQQATGDGKIAALGATLYLASGLVYALGVFATLDSLTTGFLTACLVCFYLACREPKCSLRQVVFLLGCGVFCGLAFLTKGFLAFAVPGLTAVAFLIWEKRWKSFFTLPWLILLALIAVALPWSLLIHRAEPDFWRYFIEVEHLQRFFKDEPGQHPEPFWFLLPVLVAGAFPAAFLAPAAVLGFRHRMRELFRRSLCRFAACWLVLPFLFFSASSGKLATYVLPCFAPLAVLGAVGVAAYLREGERRHRAFNLVLSGWGWLLLVAGLIACVVVPLVYRRLGMSDETPAMLLAIVVGTVWGGVLIWSRRFPERERLLFFFGGLIPLICAGQLAIPHEALESKAPAAALQLAARRFPDPEQIVVTHPSLMHAVAYELQRPDLLVRGSSELNYGFSFEPGRAINPLELNQLLNRERRPAVLFIARGVDERDLPGRIPPIDAEFVHEGIRVVHFGARP